MILHGCARCGGALVAGQDDGDLVCLSCARQTYAKQPLPYVMTAYEHGEQQALRKGLRRG